MSELRECVMCNLDTLLDRTINLLVFLSVVIVFTFMCDDLQWYDDKRLT